MVIDIDKFQYVEQIADENKLICYFVEQMQKPQKFTVKSFLWDSNDAIIISEG